MLANQVKVLIQRVKLAGRVPAKLLMPAAFRWALREQIKNSSHAIDYIYGTAPKADGKGGTRDTFCGLPIVIDNTLKEVLVQAKARDYGEVEPVIQPGRGVISKTDEVGKLLPKIDWRKVIKVDRL